MKLSIKHLRLNEYTHGDDEVGEGTKYGFWRIVEHTGAGWFPWPPLFSTRDAAEKELLKILETA